MRRREFLGQAAGALALAGCGRKSGLPAWDRMPALEPVRARMERVFRVTVCLRPFRAAGPRLEAERVGDKLVVHNYGHGGSGWSLSWGSSAMAVEMALKQGDAREGIAVIGAGALGLTSAITAQRAGAKVTIYAREWFPQVRSARATGGWTPDSRVATQAGAGAGFAAEWEKMARTSFAMYHSYLGVAGNPVEWSERYMLSEEPMNGPAGVRDEKIQFVHYQSRIADLTPPREELPAGSHPFPTRYAARTSSLTFNVAAYSKQLTSEFLMAGGKMETAEFHAPGDLKRLKERTVIHATGYGARALWGDETVVPVRGQIAWLIPQEGVNYGLMYRDVAMLGRRDGIVVQYFPEGDDTGWNDANEAPDRGEAKAGVGKLAELCGKIWRG